MLQRVSLGTHRRTLTLEPNGSEVLVHRPNSGHYFTRFSVPTQYPHPYVGMFVRVTIGASHVLRGADPQGSGFERRETRKIFDGRDVRYLLPAGQIDSRVEIPINSQSTRRATI